MPGEPEVTQRAEECGACQEGGEPSAHGPRSLQPEAERQRGECEDERQDDRDAVRFFSTTVEPWAAEPMEPPNMSESPPPLPECMRMSRIRPSAEKTSIAM